jgi:hypothetical protein
MEEAIACLRPCKLGLRRVDSLVLATSQMGEQVWNLCVCHYVWERRIALIRMDLNVQSQPALMSATPSVSNGSVLFG